MPEGKAIFEKYADHARSSPAEAEPGNIVKFNQASQKIIDAISDYKDSNDLIQKILLAAGEVFDCTWCSYYVHRDQLVYLQYYHHEGRILSPQDLLDYYPAHHEVINHLANGFTVPDGYLGAPCMENTEAVLIDHSAGTCVPEFDRFTIAVGWTYEFNCPIVIQGKPVGSFVASRPDRHFNKEEIDFGKALAKQFAIALQIQQAVENTQRLALAEADEKLAKADALAAQALAQEMSKAAESVANALGRIEENSSLADLASGLVVEIAKATDAEVACFFSYLEEENELEAIIRVKDGRVVTGRFEDEPEIMRAPFDAHITPAFQYCVKTDELFVQSNASRIVAAWPGVVEWHLAQGRHESLAYVVRAGGVVLGMLGLGFRSRSAELNPSEMRLIKVLSNQLATVLKIIRIADRAQRNATQVAVLDERNRMARELHDTLAHNLTGILMQVRLAERFAEKNVPALKKSLTELHRQAADGLTTAREAVFSLHEDSHKFKNLVECLREVTRPFLSGPGESRLEFQLEGAPYEVDSHIGFAIFRIAQEALANAFKYANAQKVSVNLKFQPDSFTLSVSDDGIGFELAQAIESGGTGIIGMKSRAARVHAEIDIVSGGGCGTCVSLRVSRASR